MSTLKRKWIVLCIVIAVVVCLAFSLFLAYLNFSRPFSAELAKLGSADTIAVRQSRTGVQVELTGEKLEAFWKYLEALPTAAATRGRDYQLRGEYGITFYRGDEQLAEIIMSSSGELGFLCGGRGRRWHYYQVQFDGERLSLPPDTWKQ